MPAIDLSTPNNKDTVRRFVRPNEHVGTAFEGDEVILDAAELAHPAIAGALWTAEEKAAAEKAEAEARAAMANTPKNATSRAVDEQLARAAKQRAEAKEKARKAKGNPEADAG